MDDRDVAEIRTRLTGLRGLAVRLDILSSVYAAGRVNLTPSDPMPLTATQKTGLKNGFDSLHARALSLTDTLSTPTGAVGVVNVEDVNNTPPSRAMEAIHTWLQNLAQLGDEPELQPDGTMRKVFTAAEAQKIADVLVTLAEIAKTLLALLRARVP